MIDHNDVYQRNFFRARIEFSKIRNSNSAMCVHIICFCKQNFTENPYVIFLVITFNVCNFCVCGWNKYFSIFFLKGYKNMWLKYIVIMIFIAITINCPLLLFCSTPYKTEPIFSSSNTLITLVRDPLKILYMSWNNHIFLSLSSYFPYIEFISISLT